MKALLSPRTPSIVHKETSMWKTAPACSTVIATNLLQCLIRAWLGAAALTAPAAERAYFRSDLGIALDQRLPAQLGAEGVRRWRTVLDSGHSTPVISAGKVFLTTFRAEERKLATVALDADTGRVLWERKAPASRLEPFHPATGSPAGASPACDGERLYVFFGSYGLICYTLDGETVWELPLGPFQDEFGASSSPVLFGESLFLCEDHDLDSFLLALDRRTGRQLWKVPRPDAVRSYSTPAFWSRPGRDELLVAGALELAAYDPASGQKLWWVHGLARIVIPVPVPSGDMVFVASWTPGGDPGRRLTLDAWPAALARWDANQDGRLARGEIDNADVLDRFFRMDLDQSATLERAEWERHAQVFRQAQNAALALKPGDARGGLTGGALVWKYQRGVPYVASPLVHKGIFWMVKDGGLVTRLDAMTGQVLSEERLPGMGGYYASPVAADGKVYFASEQGVISVVSDGPEWRVISSHPLQEKIYATPVAAGDRLFIRTQEALYSFGRNR